MIALTNSQMRECDEYAVNVLNIPSATLMKRAGEAIAEEVERVAESINARNILVVCGTGNNGGDGYVCAEELKKRGFCVEIYAFEGKLSPDCEAYKKLSKCRYSRHITGAIVVDCIFGTGLNKEATGEYKEVIEKINSSGAYVVSADIPSGLNGDSGNICGCAVKANLTVAIEYAKIGIFLGDGLDCCGEVVIKQIGIPNVAGGATVLEDCDITDCFPKRRRNSHKGTYGSANIIAGSERYAGAVALALNGALRSGCGYVKLTSCGYVKNLLAGKLPQVIYESAPDLASQAIAIGMGTGATEETYNVVCNLLKNFCGALIIDADGLNALAKFGVDVLKEKNCKVIITPHVKEFSRLTGLSVQQILSAPLEYAEKFSSEYGVTVLLKGAASIICDDGSAAVNIRGTTALSKGGSGDILSGFMCGCLARGLAPFEAAKCAAYTLGLAAEISSEEKTDYCATANDIIKNLHFAVKRLTTK